MKKTISFIVLAATGLGLLTSCHKKTETDGNVPVMTVDVAVPTVDSVVLHKTYPGYLSASQKVQLVARVDGYLTSHPFQGGDFVKKGKVLFTIEDKNYRDAVAKAEAALADAQSSYSYASSQYQAMEEALRSDAVSQMEVLQAKNSMEEAAAAIKSAEAVLRTARTSLGYCTVTAPFDGHISSTNYDNGAFLAGAGSPVVLATIYDDAKMNANFSIEDSRYLELIKNFKDSIDDIDYSKMPVNFSEVLPHSYTGDLSYMAPRIDTSTGTMVLQASIDNPYNELKDGMYATVSLPYAFEPSAILIKDASIGTDQLGKYIYVVNDSNKIVYTPIEVGETVNDTLRIVTRGIKPGEKYVTKALLKVRDGQTVAPRMTK
ncbi:MAG: efflux RND transporter periplasmic adaptor subunit [Muribaculaceae bacterium]|nr:efflux RND transporter periplasmic adaptor subunit [Muribaculaceae bacterium]